MAAKYTLVLGNKNLSSWSLRPWLAMRATGAPFEEIFVKLHLPESKAEILKHSPAGKVPILKIDDGGHTTTVWDSLAICETLAERHPEAGLWPDDAMQRARARACAAEMHSGFADLRQQLTMDFARKLPLPVLRQTTGAEIARILAAWEDALAGGGSEGFLFGRFSIADCMYAPVVSRFLTYGVELPRRSAAYCERMMALPAMQDWRRAAEAEVAEGME